MSLCTLHVRLSAMLRCIHAFGYEMVDLKNVDIYTMSKRITIIVFTILVEFKTGLAATGRSRKPQQSHPCLRQPLNPESHTSP
ncbi:hypothetical protein FKM82_013967 [Ascaphus truei]